MSEHDTKIKAITIIICKVVDAASKVLIAWIARGPDQLFTMTVGSQIQIVNQDGEEHTYEVKNVSNPDEDTIAKGRLLDDSLLMLCLNVTETFPSEKADVV